MVMKKLVLIICVVVLLITGYYIYTRPAVSPNNPSQTDSADTKKYSNTEYGFSFLYPKEFPDFVRDEEHLKYLQDANDGKPINLKTEMNTEMTSGKGQLGLSIYVYDLSTYVTGDKDQYTYSYDVASHGWLVGPIDGWGFPTINCLETSYAPPCPKKIKSKDGSLDGIRIAYGDAGLAIDNIVIPRPSNNIVVSLSLAALSTDINKEILVKILDTLTFVK